MPQKSWYKSWTVIIIHRWEVTVTSSTADTSVVGTTTVGFDDLGEAIFEDIALSKAGSPVDLTFTITKASIFVYFFQQDD